MEYLFQERIYYDVQNAEVHILELMEFSRVLMMDFR